ncbi:MAG: hypothetical protein ABJC61_03180 [Acidobacteriota bacterium]
MGQAAPQHRRRGLHGIGLDGDRDHGLRLDLRLDGIGHDGIDGFDVQRDTFGLRYGLRDLRLDVQRDAVRLGLRLDRLRHLGLDLQLYALRHRIGLDGHGLRDRDRHGDRSDADSRRVDHDDARTRVELISLLSGFQIPRLRAGFFSPEIVRRSNPARRLP